MTELLTADEMRAIETAAIESGTVTGLELMERAGAGVVDAIFDHWPELSYGTHHAVVLCGPGNNGGDGFVVARLLKERGWTLQVFLYGDPDKLPPDAKQNCERWLEVGDLTERAIDPPPLVDDSLSIESDTDLVVDALFGTGLTKPFGGPFSFLADDQVQAKFARKSVKRIAVDIPTGICSDSGRVLGHALPADLTVTFHRAKCGHFLADGLQASGKVVVADIGL